MKNVSIKNSLGIDLSVVIHGEEGVSDTLVILCPGYLCSKDYTHFVQLADRLGEIGFVVVRFDPTGTWESGGDIVDYSISQYIRDIDSVKKYLVDREDYKNIVMGGHSMGGFVSLYYASQNHDVGAVFAVMSPPVIDRETKKHKKWRIEGMRHSVRLEPDDYDKKRHFNVPVSTLDDYANYDVVSVISGMNIPKLFIAGENDDTVSPSEVKELFDMAGSPKRFHVISGAEHDYFLNKDAAGVISNHILNWLKEDVDRVGKERVIVVDPDDNVIGHKQRGALDYEDDIYRVSALHIVNSNGDVLLAQRAFNKKHNPGLFCPAVSGTVGEGETYEQNIIKEAREELGLKNLVPTLAGKTFHAGSNKHFTTWFKATIDQPVEEFIIQDEEVASIKWFPKEELKRLAKEKPGMFLDRLLEKLEIFEGIL